MSLNDRAVFDPRFAYFARGVVRGTMWGRIIVRRKREASKEWDPFTNPNGSLFEYTKIFVGKARLQPNNDWRAREYRVQGELVTEHAMRVQLDLTGNEMTAPYPVPGRPKDDDTGDPISLPGDAGLIQADDEVVVTSVYAPYGFPVDGIDIGFTYSVRIVNASSNSWTRVLLCDFIGQHVVEEKE